MQAICRLATYDSSVTDSRCRRRSIDPATVEPSRLRQTSADQHWLARLIKVLHVVAMTIIRSVVVASVCGLAIAIVPVARAADVAEGHKLAQSVCVGCHGVTTHKAGWTNAPSFIEIANRPTTTSASLEAIIETPHPRMSA